MNICAIFTALMGHCPVCMYAPCCPVDASRAPMSPLEDAIWHVETTRQVGEIIGDGGKSLGPLQISKAAWTDVAKDGEVYQDCTKLEYSLMVFRRYMLRYATPRRLGHVATNEDKARIWNGGPNGYRKGATTGYWSRVKSEM